MRTQLSVITIALVGLAAPIANAAPTIHYGPIISRGATPDKMIVHWGTAGGAQVLGFDGVGTLEVGQAADLAVYALDEPRYFGLHDPALGPVVSGGRPGLKWLVVDGQIVVESDVVRGVDLKELKRLSRAAVARLRSA